MVDEDQHIQPFEQYRLDHQEVARVDRVGLSGQELPPGRPGGAPDRHPSHPHNERLDRPAGSGPSRAPTVGEGPLVFGYDLVREMTSYADTCPRGLDIGGFRMKAIVVTDKAAGTAGMTLVERPEPQAALNDVVVQVHASGFVPTEMAWPSTWTDRLDRDRTPSIPGHELAGVVTALGYGTRGRSVGQRVFGLTDWTRDGTLAEYVAVEARNLAPLPGDVDFTVGASLPISGLTAWQGLFEHGRLQAGQSVLVHGAAGAVGSMVTQLAREAGAYVIGTGRAADRQKALDFAAQEFVDLENDALEDVGEVDLVFDVIGGDIGRRSAGLIRAGGTLVSVVGPPEARPADGLAIDFVVESDRAQLSEIVQRVRDGRLRTNIGNVATLDDAVAALNPTERRKGKTVIRVRP
ncbi:NADP-dependent oxidoreductase [Nonomuraea sp. NPDC003707]